jgi:hypothetical protein
LFFHLPAILYLRCGKQFSEGKDHHKIWSWKEQGLSPSHGLLFSASESPHRVSGMSQIWNFWTSLP